MKVLTCEDIKSMVEILKKESDEYVSKNSFVKDGVRYLRTKNPRLFIRMK